MKPIYTVLISIASVFALQSCRMPTIFTQTQIELKSAGVFETTVDLSSHLSTYLVVGFPKDTKTNDDEAFIEILSGSTAINQAVKISGGERANWLSPKGLDSLILYAIPIEDKKLSQSLVFIRVRVVPPNEKYSMWICYTSR